MLKGSLNNAPRARIEICLQIASPTLTFALCLQGLPSQYLDQHSPWALGRELPLSQPAEYRRGDRKNVRAVMRDSESRLQT